MAFNAVFRDTYIMPVIEDNIDYIAFCTNYENPDESTDIQDVGMNELGRVAVAPSSSGGRVTVNVIIPSTIACASTTVDASPTSGLTFDVVDASDFNVGDRLELILSTGAEEREIESISTNTLVFTKPFSSTPAEGNTIRQNISQVHFIKGGTTSPNTGETMRSNQWIYYKDSTIYSNTFITDIFGN